MKTTRNQHRNSTSVGRKDTFRDPVHCIILPAYGSSAAGRHCSRCDSGVTLSCIYEKSIEVSSSGLRRGPGLWHEPVFGCRVRQGRHALYCSLSSGRDGHRYTSRPVFKLSRNNSYLISSGTAICGGSAIAAVAPVIDADDNETTLSMVTVFVLNAVALLIFPAIGHFMGLSQEQFGTWAAIAIHDTSSVVGAGAAYGEEALKVATTVKLTRALWIIPLAIVTTFIFKKKGKKISIPWFIFLFIAAMLANTFLNIPEAVSSGIAGFAKNALGSTLFLIGCGLSVKSVKEVGFRPFLLGISLWAVISVSSLLVVTLV